MKRLIKKAEIYDGFNYGDNYVEIFKNPTASEIEAVRELDPYSSIRGVIGRNGDKYIWIGEIEHSSINKQINNKIPTDYFRFTYYNEGWMFHESGHGNKMMLEEFKKIISDNLDFLSQIGNINSQIDVFGLKDEILPEFSSINDLLNYNVKKIAKKLIKKSEIYDGFDYRDVYYEVYKNPTASEIQAVRKADTYSSIRGIIDQNGDKYIWIGEMGHYSINRYISNQIPTDYFRFAYSNYWIIDLKRMGANIDSNECKKIIKDNLDFLSQIGNINSPVDIIGLTDRNYLEFNSIKDFLNENNEKTAEIYDGINRGGNYYEIFKNPTSSEISLFKNNIRGAIDRNNNIYIWDGNILHFQTSPQIPLDYFRFAIDSISMYCHMSLTNITLEQCQSVIEKNISYFSQMINLNNKQLELSLSNGKYLYDSINEFLDLDLKLKEKTAEIYDGFNQSGEYCEVYKNPTTSEIEIIKKADPYGSVRGVISKNGDKYIWIGSIGHHKINQFTNQTIPTDYFRFAYGSDGREWDFHEDGYGNSMTLNECKKIIQDNLSFLSQIGSLNVSLTVVGLSDSDKYLSEYNSFEDFLNNKKVAVKLIKAINVQLQVGDQVQWKRHPYDNSVYEVKEILPNGNVFIDNGINAFTDIKQSVLKFIKRSAE